MDNVMSGEFLSLPLFVAIFALGVIASVITSNVKKLVDAIRPDMLSTNSKWMEIFKRALPIIISIIVCICIPAWMYTYIGIVFPDAISTINIFWSKAMLGLFSGIFSGWSWNFAHDFIKAKIGEKVDEVINKE